MENMNATVGDKIKFTFDNPNYPELLGKEFIVTVAAIDYDDLHYLFYAPYGPDGVPFREAKIVSE